MMHLAPYRFEATLPVGYIPPDRPSLGALGDRQFSVAQDAQAIAAAGVSTTVGILGTLSALAAASVSTAAVTAGIGAAVAGAIALAMAIYKAFEGCGQTCVITSDIANHLEPILRQNLDNYMQAPVHYASLQAAAINNFTTAWNALVQACSNPTYLQAGQRCISDRQQGACHYTTSPGGWQGTTYTPPGQNGSGPACWNWWVGYHDPIANDPTVVPDPVGGVTIGPGGTAIVGSGSTSGGSLMPLLLIAAVVAGVMLL